MTTIVYTGVSTLLSSSMVRLVAVGTMWSLVEVAQETRIVKKVSLGQ